MSIDVAMENLVHSRATPIANSTHSGLTVVIPSYHGGRELLSCLGSLEFCVSADTHILVVDNASTDGSIDVAQAHFGSMEFLRNSRNVGFGSACNQGIERALERGDEFVLLINQDTLAAPDLIERLIAFAKETPRAGVIGAKTLSTQPMPDGSPRLLYAGAWKRCLPLWQKIPGIGRADRGQATQPFEVDYVWGHGMLLRTAALQEVGLFDPGFFMYYEDMDLCLRMKAAGWQVWCDPKALMWHDVEDGPRAKKSDGWRWKLKLDSARHFHRKRYSAVTAELLLFAHVVREAASLAWDRNFQAAGHLIGAWRGGSGKGMS